MKNNLLYSTLALLFSIVVGLGCSEIQDAPIVPDEDEEVLKAVHGVCRQNLQRVNYDKVDEIANNIVDSNILLVRIAGVKEGGSMEQVIHNINTFAQKGVKILLVQIMWMDMFPEGYQKIPGPNFSVYRMSDIDLDRFRSFMNEFLEEIALHTPKDALIGLELFNEVNWGGFNGDLQPTTEGKGEVFSLETPLDYPSFQSFYTGIGKYGKCLEITKNLMNTHFSDRDVKLVTNGMVCGTVERNSNWGVNNGFTVVAPNMFITLLQGKHPDQIDKTNYFRFVDGIGIHAYPPLVDDMDADLQTYYFDPINAVLDQLKPYWITEWGFGKAQFQNKGGEERRLHYMRNFIHAIETLGGTAATTFYEFDGSSNHNIWENGVLLESGKIFQEIYNL